jgi:hypothetical protein
MRKSEEELGMFTSRISLASSDVPSLLTVSFKFGDWLIVLLQLFLTINVAIVGWILTTKPDWNIMGKVAATVVYLSIIVTNAVWIWHLRSWQMKIVKEISEAVQSINFNSLEENVQPIIRTVSRKKWWNIIFTAHIVSDLFVIYCILFLTSNPATK